MQDGKAVALQAGFHDGAQVQVHDAEGGEDAQDVDGDDAVFGQVTRGSRFGSGRCWGGRRAHGGASVVVRLAKVRRILLGGGVVVNAKKDCLRPDGYVLLAMGRGRV